MCNACRPLEAVLRESNKKAALQAAFCFGHVSVDGAQPSLAELAGERRAET